MRVEHARSAAFPLALTISLLVPALVYGASSTSFISFETEGQSLWGPGEAAVGYEAGFDSGVAPLFFGIDENDFNYDESIGLGPAWIGIEGSGRLGVETSVLIDSGSARAVLPFDAGFKYSYGSFVVGEQTVLETTKMFANGGIGDSIIVPELITTSPTFQLQSDLVFDLNTKIKGGGCADLLFDDVCGRFDTGNALNFSSSLSLVKLNVEDSGKVELVPTLQQIFATTNSILEGADTIKTLSKLRDEPGPRNPDGTLIEPSEESEAELIDDPFEELVSVAPPPLISASVNLPELGSTLPQSRLTTDPLETVKAKDNFLNVEIDVDGLVTSAIPGVSLALTATVDAGIAEASLSGSLFNVVFNPQLTILQQFSLDPTLTVDLVFDQEVEAGIVGGAGGPRTIPIGMSFSDVFGQELTVGSDDFFLEWEQAFETGGITVTPTYSLSVMADNHTEIQFDLNLILEALEASFGLEVAGFDVLDIGIGPLWSTQFGLATESLGKICCDEFLFGSFASFTGAPIELFPTPGVFTGPSSGVAGASVAWSDAANWQDTGPPPGGNIGMGGNNVTIEYENIADPVNRFSEVTIGDGVGATEAYEVGNVVIGGSTEFNGEFQTRVVLKIQSDGTLYQTEPTGPVVPEFVNGGEIQVAGELGIWSPITGGGLIYLTGGRLNGLGFRQEGGGAIDVRAPFVLDGGFVAGKGTINAYDRFDILDGGVGGIFDGDDLTINVFDVLKTINRGRLQASADIFAPGGLIPGSLTLNSKSTRDFYWIDNHNAEIYGLVSSLTLSHTDTDGSCAGSPLCNRVLIEGGRIAIDSQSTLDVPSGLWLDGVTLAGNGTVTTPSLLLADVQVFPESINRNGAIIRATDVTVGVGSVSARIGFDNNPELGQPGKLILEGGSILPGVSALLYNGEGHIIVGDGEIGDGSSGLRVENHGLIATSSTGFLSIKSFAGATPTFTNGPTGVLLGRYGRSLGLITGLYDLTEGTVIADNGIVGTTNATVFVNGANAIGPGGRWEARNGGRIEFRNPTMNWNELAANGNLNNAEILIQGSTSEFYVDAFTITLDDVLETIGTAGKLSLIDKNFVGSSDYGTGGLVSGVAVKNFVVEGDGITGGTLSLDGSVFRANLDASSRNGLAGVGVFPALGSTTIQAGAVFEGNGTVYSDNFTQNGTLRAQGGTLTVIGAGSGELGEFSSTMGTFIAENGATLELDLTDCASPCPFVLEAGTGDAELRNSTWIVNSEDAASEIKVSGLGASRAAVKTLRNAELQLNGDQAQFVLDNNPALPDSTLAELVDSTLSLTEGADFSNSNTVSMSNSMLRVASRLDPAGAVTNLSQFTATALIVGSQSTVELAAGELNLSGNSTVFGNGIVRGHGDIRAFGIDNVGEIIADDGELRVHESTINQFTTLGELKASAPDFSQGDSDATSGLTLLNTTVQGGTIKIEQGAALILANGRPDRPATQLDNVAIVNQGGSIIHPRNCTLPASTCKFFDFGGATIKSIGAGTATIDNQANSRMQVTYGKLVLDDVDVTNGNNVVIDVIAPDGDKPCSTCPLVNSELELKNGTTITGGELNLIRLGGDTQFEFQNTAQANLLVSGDVTLTNVDLFLDNWAFLKVGEFAGAQANLTIDIGTGSIDNLGFIDVQNGLLQLIGSGTGSIVTGTGEVRVFANQVLELSNVSFEGVNLSGAGIVRDLAQSTFKNLENSGNFEVSSTGNVTLVGNVENIGGTITVKNGGVVNVAEGATQYALPEGVTNPLEGDLVAIGTLPFSVSGGELVVEAGGVVAGAAPGTAFNAYDTTLTMNGGVFSSSIGGVFLQGNSVLTGTGVFDTAIENEGTVIADNVSATELRNRGLVQGGAVLAPRINATLINEAPVNEPPGIVQVSGAGKQLEINGANHSNAGTVQAMNGGLLIIDGAINNSGTLSATGSGTIILIGGSRDNSGALSAADSGTIILLGGSSANNTGNINIDGGTVELGPGLINAVGGMVNISDGGADLRGDVTNLGQMIMSGNSSSTYWDLGGQDSTLINDGEFRVSAGSMATLFVDVTGSGSYTGQGTKFFEAGFSPGSSPGLVTAEGDSMFGAGASVEMELAGLELGESYDHYRVDGKLGLGGTLNVKLLDGFNPEEGDEFDLFDALEFGGAFASLNFGDAALAAGLRWNFSQLSSNGSLSVSAVPLPAGVWLMLSALVGLGAMRRSRAA